MKYVVLLRGINVGGKNKVKMDMLKTLFMLQGLTKVKTYIQSGNVIFESKEEEITLKSKLEKAFLEEFGFESKMIFRNEMEFRKSMDELPFSKEQIQFAMKKDETIEHLYISYLEKEPTKDIREELIHKNWGEDMVEIINRNVYLLCHESIRNSKLAIHIAKTFPTTTNRNWKTVQKLITMLDEN